VSEPKLPRAQFGAVFGSEADHPQFVSNILSFRKRVLVDGLGWKLTVQGCEERDEYDNSDAVYCGIFSANSLVACFRAIRCDRPYLACAKFPQLATFRDYPRHPFAWEISRFAIADSCRRFEVCLLNYAAMFHFAKVRSAVSLVAFCDLSHERLLARIGIFAERFGEPMEIGSDTAGRPIKVVAGEIPVGRQSGLRFRKLMSLAQTMEIHDAASAVGRSCIPA
jgi:N-acyl-L-homoserine lactone synthetase